MGITLLGPVSVDGNGRLGPRDRVVLAVLALRPGEPVGAERLAEALWGDAPPPSWNKVVPGCVMRLRRALGAEAIATTPHGYRLTVPAEEVDAHRFQRLVSHGRELLARGEVDRAAHSFGEGLELWHGRALAELDDWEPGRAEAARLEGLRLDAEENRWHAELAAGRHQEVLTEAAAGVVEAPLRERRWGQLALAEYRCGRQGDALRTIHRARITLATQLGLDLGPELVELEWSILVHDPGLRAADAGPRPSAACPYLGLIPYDVGDAAAFFGRDREVAECVHRVTLGNMLAVVGPSGSGKSSLVRAGVAAALQRAGGAVTVITPGSHPMAALTEATHSALVVDQCEEATVLCTDPGERAAFFDAMVDHAAHHPVIVAIRADRLGDLAEHAAFARLVEGSMYLLGAMGEEDLRAAIEGPALDAGLVLEPGLVDVLVRDVEGEPGALPLLSHALRQTWELREGRTLTVEGYRKTGGIRGAVAHSAEALYEHLPPEQRGLLRALLLRLVATTPDGEPVRTRMPRRLVAIDADHEQLVERLVTAHLATCDETTVELAHESLARAWPRLRGWLDDDVNGQRILRHLVGAADAWDGLGRPASELYRGVRLAQALDWRDQATPDLGPVEHDFLDAARHQENGERDAASRRARARRRARTLSAAVAVLAVAGVLAATLAIRRAADQASDARSRTAAEARRAGALALDTGDPRLALLLAVEGARLDDNADTRANLHTVVRHNGGLLRTAATDFEPWQLAVSPADGTVAAVGFNDGKPGLWFHRPDTLAEAGTFGDDDGGWSGVQYRSDGAQLAVSRPSPWPAFTPRPDSLQLVDAATLEPEAMQLGGMPASIDTDVAYSADGRFIAASFDHSIGPGDMTVLVWSVSTPNVPILSMTTPGQWVPGVALSPDGSRLYVWEHNDSGGPLRAYDVASGERQAETGSLPPALRGCCPPGGGELEVSADGATVAIAEGGDVVLYDTRGPLRELAVLHHDEESGPVYDVEFSDDSAMLAAVGERGVVVWDTATHEPRVHIAGTVAAFGRNDASLYTASEAGLAEWDLAVDWRFVEVVNEAVFDHRAGLAIGLEAAVASWVLGAPAPDGDAVAYLPASALGRVLFLDTERHELVDGPDLHGRTGSWRPPAFDTIAVATADGTVALVDRRSGEVLAERRMSGGRPAIGFTDDGDRLLVGESNGQVVELDGDSLEPIGAPVDVGARIVGVYPMEGGDRAAALLGDDEHGGLGRRYAVVDLEGGVIVEEGDLGFDHAAGAMSPDGTRLAVVGLGGEVGIRRLDIPGWVRPPIGAAMSGEVRTISFAPDGSTFVIADGGGQVQLWDGTTGTQIARLVPGNVRMSASAVFHPDGHTVVITTADGAVFHWDTRVERAIEIACAAAGRNMTMSEWLEAFPDRPYQETCPAS